MRSGTRSAVKIRRLDSAEVRNRAHEIAAVLIDSVDSGASISFLAPMAPLAAVRWVFDVSDRMRRTTHLFVAENERKQIVGAVELVRAGAANQPHRADVSKILVHRSARRRGVGRALMGELESSARVLGISLLTLDAAAGGEGTPFYDALGYERVGTIPGYAIDPRGAPVDSVVFYKRL